MKSFVSTLLQGSISTPIVTHHRPKQYTLPDHPDSYVALLDGVDMTTVELAEYFGVSPTKVMKVMSRLEADLRVRRSGLEKSGGHRKTVVWSTTPEPIIVLPISKSPAERIASVLSTKSFNTWQIAKMLNLQYYSTLATCKKLELANVIRRDGVDRTKPKTPHIIWKLK